LSRTRARVELTGLVQAADAAIRRLNAEAPTPRQHRRPLDLDEVLRRLERAFGDGQLAPTLARHQPIVTT
jgi:hypothetical protein